MAEARRPDWRNTDVKASETSTTRSWQTKGTTEKAPALPSRRVLRRTIIITFVFGLAIAFGVLLNYLRSTHDACLIVAGSGYETSLLLPPNVYGWRGALDMPKDIDAQAGGGLARWFRELFGQRSGIRTTNAVPFTGSSWANTWQQIASQIQKGSENEGIILYISAHGYADELDAYLLSDVPDIKSPDAFNASRVSFSELLRSLKEVDLTKKHVLLLLDVCHTQSHWPIGMLQNDFVDRLQAKYGNDIKDLAHVTVIASTSPEQISWPAEEKRVTVFSEFVSRGLRGESLQNTNRLTASELFEFVKNNVNTWAKVNRAREQTPIMIRAENAQFELVLGSRNAEIPIPIGEKPKDPPKKDEPAKDPKKEEPKDIAKKDDAKKDDAAKDAGKKDDKAGEKKKEDAPVAKEKKDEAPKDAPKKVETTRFNPAHLADAWNAWMVLKRDHAPHVYAPHYWRLYQETLLRFEHLMRAGDPTDKASTLKKKLDSLERDIRTDKKIEIAFDCMGSSFPMPRVLGFAPSGAITDNQIKAYLSLLRADLADRNRVEALKPFDGKAEIERRYWQLRLSRAFIHEQLDDKTLQKTFQLERFRQDLQTIARDMRILSQRSAEVHLVSMLHDVESRVKLQTDLIKLAVRVRMLAEETALGVPGEADQSELYAESVFKRHQADIENADKLRRGAEDRLFGALARQQSETMPKLEEARAAYAETLNSARHLRKAHALRDDIAAVLPFYAASAALLPDVNPKTKNLIKDMQDKTVSLGVAAAALVSYVDRKGERPDVKAVEDDLESLRKQHKELCEALKGLAGKKAQINWHALHGVLTLPPAHATDADVKLRISLLAKLVSTSLELASGAHPEAQFEEIKINVAGQRKLLQASLAAYGDEVRDANPKNVEDNVRDFLLRQFAATAKKSTDPEKDDDLQGAVHHSRALIGYLGDQLIDQRRDRINPAKLLRSLRTHHLLAGLAKRTLEDHWFDPGKNDEPTYYRPVAKSFLDGAGKVLQPKDKNPLQDLMTRSQRLAGLRIAAPAPVFWLPNQDNLIVKGKIEAEAGVPAGLPTVWFEFAQGDATERETVFAPLPHDSQTTLSKDKKEFVGVGGMKVTMHALYRGQHILQPIPVDRAVPDIIARQTPGLEQRVAFATRMDKKLDYGALSIMLDTSGSMWKMHQGKRRIEHAIEGLKHVLEKLPEETYLSMSVFEDSKQKFIDHPEEAKYQRWKQGYLANKILELRGRSNKAYLDKNGSPIFKAIEAAAKDGFPPAMDFQGPKLVLALTDGCDNQSFEGGGVKTTTENNKMVKKALADLKDARPDVEVVVVCFIDKNKKEDAEEYAAAETQFGDLDNFIVEKDGASLGKRIEEILRPRVQLKRGGEPLPGSLKGHLVDYQTGVVKWHPLNLGDYKAEILKSRGDDFPLEMSHGHNLFAVLNRKERKFLLERGLIGLQPEVKKAVRDEQQQKAGWLVTLLNNENLAIDTSAKQILCFEKMAIESGGIRLTRPNVVWFELDDPNGKRLDQPFEWGTDLVVPAPSYEITVSNWRQGRNAFPKVHAWFWPSTSKELRDLATPVFDERVNVNDFRNRKSDVIVDIQPDNRLVTVMGANGLEARKGDCLVIQARYRNDGTPVYIDLKNKDPRVGSEHKFFHQAGITTACFYGPRVNAAEIDVVVYSVADIKNAAESLKARVTFAPDQTIQVPAVFRGAIIEAINGK